MIRIHNNDKKVNNIFSRTKISSKEFAERLFTLSPDDFDRNEIIAIISAAKCHGLSCDEIKSWLAISFNNKKIKGYSLANIKPKGTDYSGFIINKTPYFKADKPYFIDNSVRQAELAERQRLVKIQEENDAAKRALAYSNKRKEFDRAFNLSTKSFCESTYGNTKTPQNFINNSSIYFSKNIKIYNNTIFLHAENRNMLQYIFFDYADKCHHKRYSIEKSGDKKGAYLFISESPDCKYETIYITEGFANALAIAQQGCCVAICFDSGNMPLAIQEIKKDFRNRIIVFADNDISRKEKVAVQKMEAGEITPADFYKEDYGKGTGELAAIKSQVDYILPEKKDTDANDIWLEGGDELIASYIANNITKYVSAIEIDNANYLDAMQKLAELNKNHDIIKDDNTKQVQLLDTAFLPDVLNYNNFYKENSHTIIKSVQSTGKTHLAKRLIRQIAKRNLGTVVYVVKSCFLSSSIYNDLKAALVDLAREGLFISYYGDYKSNDEQNSILNSADIMIVTPESIRRINTKSNLIALAIFDESEQTFDTLASLATHKDKLSENFAAIKALGCMAKSCLYFDADAGFSTDTIIDAIDGENNKVYHRDAKCTYRITNTFKHPNRDVKVYVNLNLTLEKAYYAIEAGKKTFNAFTKKAEAEEFYNTVNTLGKKGLLITADTKNSEEVREFMLNLDATSYDFIVVSPAAGTGLSIENHNFDETFCFFSAIHGITSADVLQLMQRVRSIDKYTVYIPKVKSGDYKKRSSQKHSLCLDAVKRYMQADAKREIKKRRTIARAITTSYKHGMPVFEPTLLAISANVQVKKNISSGFWFSSCIAELKTKGFNVAIDEEAETVKKGYDKKNCELRFIARQIRVEEGEKVPLLTEHLYRSQKMLEPGERDRTLLRSFKKTSTHLYYHDENTVDLPTQVAKVLKNSKALKNLETVVHAVFSDDFEFDAYCLAMEKNNPHWHMKSSNKVASLRGLYRDIFEFLDIKEDSFGPKVFSVADCEEINELLEKHYIFTARPIFTLNNLLKKIGVNVGCKQVTLEPKTEKSEAKKRRDYQVHSISIMQNVIKHHLRRETSDIFPKVMEFVEVEKPYNSNDFYEEVRKRYHEQIKKYTEPIPKSA